MKVFCNYFFDPNLMKRLPHNARMILVLMCIVFSLPAKSSGNDHIVPVVAACTDPTWSTTVVYTQGNRVSYNNKVYEARWWTQGENPELRSGEWDVWKYIGPCSGGNVNPSVSITAPVNGATFTAPATVTIQATASDSDGTIAKVEFYQGGTKLGEDSSSPYSFTWSNVSAGSYSLTAKATDNANGTTTSSAVSISVSDGGNVSPVANIISPVNNTTYTAPATVTITASATDSDGTISKVEFFNGGAKLGEDATTPYSFSWSNVAAGSYSLTAVATDNNGATGTSAVVAITVSGDTGGGNCNVPTYVNGSTYNTGDEVKHNNKKYKCEVGGWCSLGGAYEPGVGWAWDNAWEYEGDCAAGNGPSVSITAPANNTTVDVGQVVTITASATDADGTITRVEFFLNGSSVGTDTSFPYTTTLTATQGIHSLTARAMDNSGNTAHSSPVIIRAGSTNTGDLPARILSGYWHTWNGGVPFIKLRDVSLKWDVINVSFAEPVAAGSTDGQMKFVLSGATASYTVADFKSDIRLLQSQGKKIVISIGGYEGYFSLTTAGARDNFVNGMKAIIDEYGFDGIDIDLEQSSLELQVGDADFRNPTSAKVVHMITAIRTLCDHYGSDFILSFAPEAFYLQLGYQWYAGIHSSVDRRAGVYIPVIHALRDKLTYVQAQLYNQPSVMALDGKMYSSGTSDYLVSMSDMLLKGFNVGGNPNYFFPPLRPDQVLFGVPASAGAAGSGQVTAQQLHQAFDYMVKGNYGGQYSLTSTYPSLRGIMTWSINWDVYQNNGAFVNTHRTYLDGLGALSVANATASGMETSVIREQPSGEGSTEMSIYPNPAESDPGSEMIFSFPAAPGKVKVQFSDAEGVSRYSHEYPVAGSTLQVEIPSLPPGVYYIHVTSGKTTWTKRYLIK